VVRMNNLKADPDEVMEAIRIVNEVGGDRKEGIPDLLPGLNFIAGLAGETKRTFLLNEQFLDRVLASGLLVRRVNIRQLMPFEGTQAYDDNTLGKHTSQFRAFKEYVRKKFDLPMLRQVYPIGTILHNVIIEEEGALSFGRQMGSYPILVGIPVRLKRHTVLDTVVVDHGMRSLTGLPVPVQVNLLPSTALKWIPGIGPAAAARIVGARPLPGLAAFHGIAGTTPVDHLLAFTRPSAQ